MRESDIIFLYCKFLVRILTSEYSRAESESWHHPNLQRFGGKMQIIKCSDITHHIRLLLLRFDPSLCLAVIAEKPSVMNYLEVKGAWIPLRQLLPLYRNKSPQQWAIEKKEKSHEESVFAEIFYTALWTCVIITFFFLSILSFLFRCWTHLSSSIHTYKLNISLLPTYASDHLFYALIYICMNRVGVVCILY